VRGGRDARRDNKLDATASGRPTARHKLGF
jgi:hypothetical protein